MSLREAVRQTLRRTLAYIGREPRWYLLIKKVVPPALKAKLYPLVMLSLPDRRYLEDMILPALQGLKPGRVLFVGTREYTSHYGSWFEGPTCEYWTLDIDPAAAMYGAKGRHLVGDVLTADRHFPPDFFNVVILNGVFGYGVDRVEDQNRLLEAMQKILRAGGIILLGWDTDRVQEPLELTCIKEHYAHGSAAPLPARTTFPTSQHVYDFFTRR